MQQHKEGSKTQMSSDEFDAVPRLSNPAKQALAAAGYTRLQQLTQVRESDIARLHGMGPKGIRLIRAALAERGQSFAEDS